MRRAIKDDIDVNQPFPVECFSSMCVLHRVSFIINKYESIKKYEEFDYIFRLIIRFLINNYSLFNSSPQYSVLSEECLFGLK